MRIVLDTNVLVSATFWSGDSLRIMELVADKKVKLIICLSIISECMKIINSDEILYKKTQKKLSDKKIVRAVIQETSVIMVPTKKLSIVKEDPDDNKIIGCALSGKADYIITKDNHLLKIKNYKGIKIVTPKEFLKTILIRELDNLTKKSKLTKQDVIKFGKKVKKAATKKFLKNEN